MCRLYGFRANEPTKVECALVHAQNALLAQSRSDLEGVAHPDGWGIGLYENGVPELERRATAAFEDVHFSVTAERVFARTVLAHVRQATVGGPSLANTHPFGFGDWMFAHNGTITAFDRVRPLLEEEIAPELRGHWQGTTDSELYFFWLLSRALRAGIDLAARPAASELAAVVAEAVPYLDAACERCGPEEPAKLNLLVTDGTLLVASRWRRSLHWVVRDELRDCEICGIPHIHHESGTDYRAVVVASEPISDEDWNEVPEGAVVAVDAELRVEVRHT